MRLLRHCTGQTHRGKSVERARRHAWEERDKRRCRFGLSVIGTRLTTREAWIIEGGNRDRARRYPPSVRVFVEAVCGN